MANSPGLVVLVEFLFLAMVYFAVIGFRDYKPEHRAAISEVLTTNSFMAAVAFVISYVLYFNFF